MTRIERFGLPLGHDGVMVEASIMEVLAARWLQGSVYCEVNDDLPPVKWRFFLLSEDSEIPVVERPTRMRMQTFGDEQVLEGAPEKVAPVFCCEVSGSPRPLFLYRLAE